MLTTALPTHYSPAEFAPLRHERSLSNLPSGKAYDKGSFVYLFSEANPQLLMLEQGFIRLGIYTEEGEEMTTTVLKPGDLFGSFSARITDDEFAQALTDARVQTIDQATFYQLLSSRPSSQDFVDLICARFAQLKNYFIMTTAMQVRERIITFFRFLAKHCGYAQEGNTVIDNFLTHQDIACITNTRRQTVTTRLLELQEEGLLRYSRKRIVLFPSFGRYVASKDY